jgi:hypothetical protein
MEKAMNFTPLKSLLAVGLIATAMPNWAAEAICPPPASTTNAQTQKVGAFTGRFVDGAPVYRLPAMVVVANRQAELARMEHEEQSTRAKQARAKPAARPPA